MGCSYIGAFARFICTLENNYKLKCTQYKVVSHGFIFVIKGLLVFLMQFCPCCVIRKLHFHYVASRHELVIQLLHLYFCFNSCARPKLNLLFPLHSLCAPTFLYLFHLDKCSIEATVGENVGEHVEANVGENQTENKTCFALFFRDLVFGNHRCVVEGLFTPCGPRPCGFDCTTLTDGCLFLMAVPRAPQVPLGSPLGVFLVIWVVKRVTLWGSQESSWSTVVVLVDVSDSRDLSGALGTPEGSFKRRRLLWLAGISKLVEMVVNDCEHSVVVISTRASPSFSLTPTVCFSIGNLKYHNLSGIGPRPMDCAALHFSTADANTSYLLGKTFDPDCNSSACDSHLTSVILIAGLSNNAIELHLNAAMAIDRICRDTWICIDCDSSVVGFIHFDTRTRRRACMLARATSNVCQLATSTVLSAFASVIFATDHCFDCYLSSAYALPFACGPFADASPSRLRGGWGFLGCYFVGSMFSFSAYFPPTCLCPCCAGACACVPISCSRLFLSESVCPSASPFVCQFVCVSSTESTCQSVCESVCQSVCLSVSQCARLSLSPSICVCPCQPVFQSCCACCCHAFCRSACLLVVSCYLPTCFCPCCACVCASPIESVFQSACLAACPSLSPSVCALLLACRPCCVCFCLRPCCVCFFGRACQSVCRCPCRDVCLSGSLW